VEASRVWSVMRYVERNPARARMVNHAWEWPWSSAEAHVTEGAGDPMLDPEWSKWLTGARLGGWDFGGWRAALSGQAEDEEAGVRRATLAGEPLGPEWFVTQMESGAGRRLRVLKRGRPALERVDGAEAQGALFE